MFQNCYFGPVRRLQFVCSFILECLLDCLLVWLLGRDCCQSREGAQTFRKVFWYQSRNRKITSR